MWDTKAAPFAFTLCYNSHQSLTRDEADARLQLRPHSWSASFLAPIAALSPFLCPRAPFSGSAFKEPDLKQMPNGTRVAQPMSEQMILQEMTAPELRVVLWQFSPGICEGCGGEGGRVVSLSFHTCVQLNTSMVGSPSGVLSTV